MTANKEPLLENYSVSLKVVDQANQALLFNWRNQSDIRQQMVSQNMISQAEHSAWFLSLSDSPNQQHFVIYYKDTPIGAINLKCHDGLALKDSSHGEVGLYIAHEKYQNNIIAFAPSLVINDYAFTQLKITRLSSKVRADNIAALKYNQQLGYDLSKAQSGFIDITLTAKNYNKHSQTLKKFLNRGSRIVDR